MTFTSNVKQIVKNIEQAQKNLQESKVDGLKQLTNASFVQIGNKYIVKGNYAKPSKSGKTLQYLTPPGGNISRKRTLYNKKTKFKKVIQEALWVAGKVVSRSGNYEKIIGYFAKTKLNEGNNFFNGLRIEVLKDRINVWADDKSEVFKLETFKQVGKTKIQPITKAFRSIVSLWKSVRIKLGSK